MQLRERDNFRAAERQDRSLRVYTLCYFGRDYVVPEVELIDAATDDEAIEAARHSHPFMRREVWDRHRLVATISADYY